MSAEAVADAADRTTGALYSHFGGKEGLLLALLEVWRAETVADLLAATDEAGLGDRLGALWAAFSGTGGPGDAWLLLEMELWLHGARDATLAAPLAERFADSRQRLAVGLADWAAEADVPLSRSADELAPLVLGLLLGLSIQRRLDPAAIADDAVLDALLDLLTGSLVPAGATSAPARPAKGSAP